MATTYNEDNSKTYSIAERQEAKKVPEKKNGKGKGRKI